MPSHRVSATARSLSIVVQGEKSCEYMEKCIVAFLGRAPGVEKLSDEDFGDGEAHPDC